MLKRDSIPFEMMKLTMSIVVFSHKSTAIRTFIYLSEIFNYYEIEKKTKHPGLSLATIPEQNVMDNKWNKRRFHSFLFLFNFNLQQTSTSFTLIIHIITNCTIR